MANLPSLRASDSDRQQVAERLRQATEEGRLSADELEGRLDALFASKTYGELDALVDDLPVPSAPGEAQPQLPRWFWAVGASTLLLTVLGMLASVGHHAGEAFYGPRDRGYFDGTRPMPASHHVIAGAASTTALLMMLAVFGTAIWLMRSMRASDD